MPEPEKKVYLGDSVYAAFDGYHIVLTTENGLGVSNRVLLEPEVIREFVRYAYGFSSLRPFVRPPEAGQ